MTAENQSPALQPKIRTGDVLRATTQEKRDVERRFVAASIGHDTKIALSEYAWVSPDSFCDVAAGKVWRALLESQDPMVALDAIQNDAGFIDWINQTPDLKRIDHYADRMVALGREIDFLTAIEGAMKFMSARDLMGAVDIMSKTLSKDSNQGKPSFENIDTIVAKFNASVKQGWDGVSTGLSTLDNALGLLQRTQLSVLAARTSVGKTALAWQMAQYVASMGKKAIYFSTELRGEDLWARTAAGSMRIEWRDVVAGKTSELQNDLLIKESTRLAQQFPNTLFVDSVSRKLSEIHHAVAACKPDFIVVDHLDEIDEDDKKSDSPVMWLAAVVTYLRNLSKKYNAHVMCVHQLNRGAEEGDRRPVLSDLRWSGDIEQKADCVMMLYRPDLSEASASNSASNVKETELWIRKNRIGSIDTVVRLEYALKEQKFYLASPERGA